MPAPRRPGAAKAAPARLLETSMPQRRLPVGAEVQPGGGVHFRVWAPARTRVEVAFDGDPARVRPELAACGITCLEVMPVAEFPGRFGWGYDGVYPFAPTRLYGRPADFRRFVDAAHAAGLGVILDVVYNHLGPDGNYLKQFADDYFSTRYSTEWGEPLNFDGPHSGPVRELYFANAGYWIEEYHLDGLRLHATQQVHDAPD